MSAVAQVPPNTSVFPASDAGNLNDVFVARQPIYDAQLNVVGYEVLFRNSRENKATIIDADQATSQLLLNFLVEIGVAPIVGKKNAYLNMTRSFLTGRMPLPLEPERIVLEVLENINVDAELVEGVRNLSKRGFIIALDDAVYHDRLQPLLELADIIKVELSAIPPHELASHVSRFRRHRVKLLAEKVETIEQFQQCKKLGFDLFQGYFLSRPQIIQGKPLGANQTAVLRVLASLANENTKIDELDRIVRQDAILSFKLLRYINSSKFALRRKIDSIRGAIVLLGMQGVRTLAMLLSISSIPNKPPEVLLGAMLRAIFCEKLADKLRDSRRATFFTAGLISALDAVLDMPLPDVLRALPLTEDIKRAILTHETQIGLALKCAIAYDRADWININCLELQPSQIRDAYLESLREACEMASGAEG